MPSEKLSIALNKRILNQLCIQYGKKIMTNHLEFFNNLDGCTEKIQIFIVSLVEKFYKNNRYFSTITGANMCKSLAKSRFDVSNFVGYLGFNMHDNNRVNTFYVKPLLRGGSNAYKEAIEKDNFECMDILRLKLSKSMTGVNINGLIVEHDQFSDDNTNRCYISKYEQFGVERFRTNIIKYTSPSFDIIIDRLIKLCNSENSLQNVVSKNVAAIEIEIDENVLEHDIKSFAHEIFVSLIK